MVLAIECRLSCCHIFLATSSIPHKYDKVWCVKCDTSRTILVVKEWHIKCISCKYGRFCGSSRSVANRLAKQHHNRTGHVVKIMFPGKPAVTLGDEEVTQSSFPNLLDT